MIFYLNTFFLKFRVGNDSYMHVNASLYDIRTHFQGKDAKERIKNKSNDEKYMELIGNLRNKLKVLAQKIEPKVYEYGFLKE